MGNAPSVQDTFDMRGHDPQQPSLFHMEDLAVPASVQNLKKAVSAIHTTPIKPEHNHSLNHRRLFDACIMVAQIDFKNRDPSQTERVKNERISPMFEVRTSELSKLAGVTGKNYQRIYDALNDLYDVDLYWNVVGEDANVEWEMKSRFLTTLGIGKGEKAGWVRFAFDPSILEIVLEPKNWATLSLQTMKKLPTSASYALYQNVWRYVNTNQKVTANLPVETWVELLVGKSRYIKDDPEQGKVVVNYGEFKRRVLNPSIEAVNSVKALSYTIKLIEDKAGNRVARLQFKFVPKNDQEQSESPTTWPADVLAFLESLGYTRSEIADMSQAYNLPEVSDAILRLKSAQERMKKEGRSVSSIKAYFAGILAKITASGGKEIDPAAIQAEIERQEAVKRAAERQEKLRQQFDQHQRTRFFSWMAELPQTDRDQLLHQFQDSKEGNAARLIKGGWKNSAIYLQTLRTWLSKNHPDLVEQAFDRPEYRSFEEWMAWKLEGNDAIQSDSK